MFAGNLKEKRHEESGNFIYAMWGCWKERNRRVFRYIALQPDLVAHLVWQKIEQRRFAHTQDPRDV